MFDDTPTNWLYIFHSLPNTKEVITRSTANVWVVGQRIHKRDDAGDTSELPPLQGTDSSSGDSTETEDSFEPLMEREDKQALSCTELYLIAAKKDSTLVDVKGRFENTFMM
jgi:hypothetical protein